MYTLKQAAVLLGIPSSKLKRLITLGAVGGLGEEEIDRLASMMEDYTGLAEYAAERSCGRFDGSDRRDVVKLLSYLEKNGWFGIEHIPPCRLPIGNESQLMYFPKDAAAILDSRLDAFLSGFGMPVKERALELLARKGAGHPSSEALKEFTERESSGGSLPPAYLDFLERILAAPDVLCLDDGDIRMLFSNSPSPSVRAYLVRFLNQSVSQHQGACYSRITLAGNTAVSPPAYPAETFLELARCIFSPEYIEEHRMIPLALKDSFFIEMWLYHALLFVCGWRAADICRHWGYPHLGGDGPEIPGVCPETLERDILDDGIPNQVYVDVCMYAVRKTTLAMPKPSKTISKSPPALSRCITPEIRPFFGMLTLIAECHQLAGRGGYMDSSKPDIYQRIQKMAQFYGDGIVEVLGEKNLLSRRMNKSFLQGIEEEARADGCEGLMASAVASFARSHMSLETVRIYLKDHRLDGENAEMVLYFMMERGVLSFGVYQAILGAYPEAFRRLPIASQNRLLSLVGESPLGLELGAACTLAAEDVGRGLIDGDVEQAAGILKAMFEISQDRGKSKDDGVYCLERAKGMACRHPEYASCLAGGCDSLVFTRYGIPALTKVVSSYRKRAEGGDAKAFAVLKQHILPRYKEILNRLIRDTGMDEADRTCVRHILEKELADGNQKNKGTA